IPYTLGAEPIHQGLFASTLSPQSGVKDTRDRSISHHCATCLFSAKKTPPCPRCLPHVTAACPDGWVGYQGNCYYFSETEGNWNNSQSHCSSLNASLASIDSVPELNFMLRYREIPYRWIGLQKEQGEGQPWKWTNGTIFNNLFQVRGEGQCAYLDDHGVSSSRCYSERHFICSQTWFPVLHGPLGIHR
uniref:C-type lectin domain-containing protein n=1 Tax=Chrysemys picta bellii TaxID=8478 RepID=A0A8C3I1F4_CHRPI